MPTSGDIVLVDLEVPSGREAGFSRPAVVVTAALVLKQGPPIVHVVPLTSRLRGFDTDVVIAVDDDNGLDHDSAAQCQHVRAVSAARLSEPIGSITPLALRQVRETLALLLDI